MFVCFFCFNCYLHGQFQATAALHNYKHHHVALERIMKGPASSDWSVEASWLWRGSSSSSSRCGRSALFVSLACCDCCSPRSHATAFGQTEAGRRPGVGLLSPVCVAPCRHVGRTWRNLQSAQQVWETVLEALHPRLRFVNKAQCPAGASSLQPSAGQTEEANVDLDDITHSLCCLRVHQDTHLCE